MCVYVCRPKRTFSPGFPVGPFAPLPPRAPYWKTNNSSIRTHLTPVVVKDKRVKHNASVLTHTSCRTLITANTALHKTKHVLYDISVVAVLTLGPLWPPGPG